MTTQFKETGDFVVTNDGAFAIRPEQYVDFVSFTQQIYVLSSIGR